MKKMGMPLLFACVPLLAGCYAGIGHMLEEDYNPRFAVGERAANPPPTPTSWRVYTELEGEGKGTESRFNKSGPIILPTSIKENHPEIFPLPDNFKWYIKTPEGVVPEETVDVTCYYAPEAGCLVMPPQDELGLFWITWDGPPYYERYTLNPEVESHYRIIGEGTLDDGTGIRILSYLVTYPS